jgi:cardiolipin synthase
VPLLGPLLYLAFGVDRLPEKGWRKQVHDESFLAERRARESEAFPLAYWSGMYDQVAGVPEHPVEQKIDRALQSILPDFPLLGGNAISLLVDGTEAFPRMLKAIEKAEHHIHLQTFIVGNDEIGMQFFDLLERKAREGVEVRVLYDRFGSTWALLGGFFRPYHAIPNMQVVGWTQANPLKRQFQVNLRNHRKALIIDGKQAFCGGINIHRQATRGGVIRDYQVEVSGPAALELQYTFMRDWNFMTDEGPEALLRDVYFPHSDLDCGALARLVNSGPTSEMGAVCDAFFVAITTAETQVLVVTPYFVPERDMLRALRSAALRGVDVRLVLPRRCNHFYAGMASQAFYDELLDVGVRIFRRPEPFMHAKACIIDGRISLVGTANMDSRSLRLNYETNMAVYDEEFTNRLKSTILDDLSISEEVHLDEWRSRPVAQRFAENAAALMMPVL